MDKKQKILLLIIGVLVIIAIVIGVLAFKEEKNNPDTNKINEFKEEYELLNGVTDDDGYTYPTVEVDVDAPVEYVTLKEVLNIIEKKDVVIYFGNSKDYLCRNIMNSLLSAINSVSIDTLYYVDTKNLESNTSKEYQELLKIIDGALDKSEMTDQDGNKVATIEKKIYSPTVVVIRNKELVDYHLGSVESHMSSDTNKELTKEQSEELFDIYTSMFFKISNSSCNEDTKC